MAAPLGTLSNYLPTMDATLKNSPSIGTPELEKMLTSTPIYKAVNHAKTAATLAIAGAPRYAIRKHLVKALAYAAIAPVPMEQHKAIVVARQTADVYNKGFRKIGY